MIVSPIISDLFISGMRYPYDGIHGPAMPRGSAHSEAMDTLVEWGISKFTCPKMDTSYANGCKSIPDTLALYLDKFVGCAHYEMRVEIFLCSSQ